MGRDAPEEETSWPTPPTATPRPPRPACATVSPPVSNGLRADYAKWRVYRNTIAELAALSNRDLADLGLSRSMISSVAHEAAYGQ